MCRFVQIAGVWLCRIWQHCILRLNLTLVHVMYCLSNSSFFPIIDKIRNKTSYTMRKRGVYKTDKKSITISFIQVNCDNQPKLQPLCSVFTCSFAENETPPSSPSRWVFPNSDHHLDRTKSQSLSLDFVEDVSFISVALPALLPEAQAFCSIF